MRELPEDLLHRPFHRDDALHLGVSARVLEGARFIRVHPRVYRYRGHELTFGDRVAAARMALPPHVHLTGITRLQVLGLPYGATSPLRFVVEGDLHLALNGIFLHRTRLLSPVDQVGVVPAGAFVSYCGLARTLDAIKVGDWLIGQESYDLRSLQMLALAAPWRAGALETMYVLDHLEGRSRSFMESETRAVLDFAGLPVPLVNHPIELGGGVLVLGDLWYPEWQVVIEYEGSHHQLDRDQYVADVDRYALYRRSGLTYVQVTKEKIRNPRAVAREVHRALVVRGYDGPAPEFGPRWDALFARVSSLIDRQELLGSWSSVS